MNTEFTHRKATISDLEKIIKLLIEDELGSTREVLDQSLDQGYLDAFQSIDKDPNQYLMVVLNNQEIIGTCHLTIMPSLTMKGSTRMQIEAVRVKTSERGKKIGEWMIKEALEYGKSRGAQIAQLTTNKKRDRAKKFYEKLGFVASHEGMKLSI